MKECTKCRESKSYSMFGKHSTRPDGLQDWCRQCFKVLKDAQKDKKAKYDKEYYIKNKSLIKERCANYYSDNSEKIKERAKEWSQGNREKSNLLHLRKNRNRRAQKFNQMGEVLDDYWDILLFEADYKCQEENCTLEISKTNPLTLDHVIPLSKGGLHDMSNFQVLCKSCNSSKGSKLIP